MDNNSYDKLHDLMMTLFNETNAVLNDPRRSMADFYNRYPPYRDFALKYPRYNLEEHDDHYVYKFDVPGVKKEDLSLSEDGGFLVISGKREESVDETTDNYKYCETKHGSFTRRVKLENDATPTLSAQLVDGVLNVRVEKLVRKDRVSTIPIF